MLDNFHLVTIVKKGSAIQLLHVPLHQALQDALAESWHTQYNAFLEDIEEIEFDAGYQPEKHERFCIDDYELPEWLEGENSQTVSDLDVINQNEEWMESIKGISAFAQNEDGQELILFQNFSRSRVIQPGGFIFQQNNTYKTAHHKGLTLDKKLSAVYDVEQQKLLFHSFRTTNTFLPLADYYKEASENEIREILEHDLFEAEDIDSLAEGANQWFRKRFAMLRDSEILDNYSAQEIQDLSENYELDIQISEDQIIFPADKHEAKRLLQFLNEEIFRGAITDTLYETNSKKEAD